MFNDLHQAVLQLVGDYNTYRQFLNPGYMVGYGALAVAAIAAYMRSRA